MSKRRSGWAVRRRPSRPYTEIGIRRLPCVRCGKKPSYSTWQICTDGRAHRPLCAQCDYDLNEMVLRWMKHPDTEVLLEQYRISLAREGHFVISSANTNDERLQHVS